MTTQPLRVDDWKPAFSKHFAAMEPIRPVSIIDITRDITPMPRIMIMTADRDRMLAWFQKHPEIGNLIVGVPVYDDPVAFPYAAVIAVLGDKPGDPPRGIYYLRDEHSPPAEPLPTPSAATTGEEDK